MNEANGSFSIVLTHKPRLHIAVNKGGLARGRNCDNSYCSITLKQKNLLSDKVKSGIPVRFLQVSWKTAPSVHWWPLFWAAIKGNGNCLFNLLKAGFKLVNARRAMIESQQLIGIDITVGFYEMDWEQVDNNCIPGWSRVFHRALTKTEVSSRKSRPKDHAVFSR